MPHPLHSHFQSIAANNGLVLLYHSIADYVPEALETSLHNTSPLELMRHIEDLSNYFSFVSLEEFAHSRNKKGLAAVSFDDGYANVLENAVPVLEAVDCPATLFLNPLTFEGHWNWRDKVRYIVYHQLEEAFCTQYDFANCTGRFYRFSKHPDNNSQALDFALDQFLDGHEIDLYSAFPYLGEFDLAPAHPLLTYGNHSQNHYVLASLSYQQQYREIEIAHHRLEKITGKLLSTCFSAPFGGSDDTNHESLEVVAMMGYRSLLMSRQKLNSGTPDYAGIQLIERFMPRSADILSEISHYLY